MRPVALTARTALRSQGKRGFSSTARRLDTYAFIGLGQMGYQMARNLQAKLSPTDTIRLYDINPAAAERLATEMTTKHTGGAKPTIATTAAEAAHDASTILTCLPEPAHVLATYTSILASPLPALPTPRLLIDHSTIDPSTSRRVAALASSASATFLDAPMSGGVIGATAGTLTFMVGCPSTSPLLAARVSPVLLKMGARVLPCGPQGAGLAAKLANNYLLAVQNVAVCEAMRLGVASGLDAAVLAGVINSSTGRCWASEVNNPVPGVVEGAPAGRGYAGGFGIGLMRKDLGLARVAAKEVGVGLVLGERVGEVYEEAEREEGRGDFSVVYRWLEGRDGKGE
ncbi:NAD binding domain of 6-phosphogluconate dehydrogenase-domain-containing protein [Podospora conica]|nr:NAD binding domain of 6-phosphogluconate dehydrogenase-domain-containing protein [Schizothecium conicum]